MEHISDQWARLETSSDSMEKIWTKRRSFGQDVWLRFCKRITALLGLVGFVVIALFAFVGPYFTPYDYSDQQLELASLPARMKVATLESYPGYFYITPTYKVMEIDADGKLLRQLPKTGEDSANRRFLLAYSEEDVIYLNYGENPLSLSNDLGESATQQQSIRNRSYLLGTDHLGRDILTRLMYGSRISLVIALVATLVNMVIGILYGGISGYIGGRLDAVMMRIVDIISTIPLALYVILIKVTLNDSGLLSIIVALGSVYWVNMARVVRGQVMTLKNQEFVTAARTIGTGNRSILLTHLIPNAMGPILVTATMLIPSAIFMEAFMSYIGIGIAPPMASLGTMCNDATEYLRSSPHQLFMPAIMICVIMFAFNFIGDGLRDALDPKLKK